MSQPNFIFILADDIGYADLGCAGARASELPGGITPNLDRMAADGLFFTHGYSNSPVCSPTRFALATGRYQYRLRGAAEEPLAGVAKGNPVLGLPPSHPTLASVLRDAGYATALIGKWHLGFAPHFGPLKSGYEYHFGPYAGGVDYFNHCSRGGEHDLWENETEVERKGYLTDLLSARAEQYVRDNAKAKKPFLLSLHYTAPHWPWETRDDEAESRRIDGAIAHVDGGSIATYRRMIHHMDEGIGSVMSAVRETGIERDTLTVFTSDNGGERFSDNWPFVGNKMDLMEGGIRVPLIARWPSRIDAGSRTGTAAITMDWVATMFEAAGVSAHADYPLDGVSLLPLFVDPAWDPRRKLYWRMAHRKQRALLDGRWKYLRVEANDYLFKLDVDERERSSQAKREPQRLEAMRADWETWAATMPGIPEDARVSLVFGEGQMPRSTY
jgi:arylsulfatase A-like enzyme